MYIFELGRDKDLSILEIVSLLKKLKIEYKLLDVIRNLLFIEINDPEFESKNLIERLGGTLRILKKVQEITDISDFDMNLVDVYTSKSFYYAFNFFGLEKKDIEGLLQGVKLFFKQNKLKGVLKDNRFRSIFLKREEPVEKKHKNQRTSSEDYKTSFISPSDYYSARLDETFEISIFKKDDEFRVYKTIGCSDPKLFKELDEKRPFRSIEHSSSFRLARIMVNILDTKEGKNVVDPFCGTGTYLMEGMRGGYNMIGLDASGKMVAGSQQNADWAKKKFNFKTNYWAKMAPSAAYEFSAAGCVFEPYLGPLLKKKPDVIKAKEILEELNSIYTETFRNLDQKLEKGSMVVCILPEFIATNNRPYGFDEELVIHGNNFRILSLSYLTDFVKIANPIVYDTPDGSILKRKLYILRKLI